MRIVVPLVDDIENLMPLRIRIPISYEVSRYITIVAGFLLGMKSAWDSIFYNSLQNAEAAFLMLFAVIHFLVAWLSFKHKFVLTRNWSLLSFVWVIALFGTIYLRGLDK